jgi:hypothetical protein
MRPASYAFACLALCSCSAVVPSTAARLATLDPLTADPAGIELVVILPPGLAVKPGSAKLEFGATRGTESRTGSFTLADQPVVEGIDLPEGASARRYALTAEDAGKMRDLQTEIAGWKRDGTAKGSLGLGVDGCGMGDGPAPDATGSVLIRLRPGASFLPLIAERKLADLLGPEALSAIQPCNGAN